MHNDVINTKECVGTICTIVLPIQTYAPDCAKKIFMVRTQHLR